jgi:hypothetical protein
VQEQRDSVEIIGRSQVAIQNGRAGLVGNPDAVVQRFGECYDRILDYIPPMPKAVALIVFILSSGCALSTVCVVAGDLCGAPFGRRRSAML